MNTIEALDLHNYWHERARKAERKLKEVLSIGTRVRSLNWSKPYGYITGWEETLGMAIIQWDGIANYGPEACEPDEYEIISPKTVELKLLQTIKGLDESIAVEQALDSMHRKEA